LFDLPVFNFFFLFSFYFLLQKRGKKEATYLLDSYVLFLVHAFFLFVIHDTQNKNKKEGSGGGHNEKEK
jgi:hypothetical protein